MRVEGNHNSKVLNIVCTSLPFNRDEYDGFTSIKL